MNIVLIIVVAVILTFLLTAFQENKKSKVITKDLEKELSKINIKQVESVKKEKKQTLSDDNNILKITTLHKQQQFLECIEACNKFLLNENDNYKVLLIKAESLSLYGNKIKSVKYLEEAVDILEKLEKTRSNDLELLFVLGDTWIRLAFAKGKTETDENIIIKCANTSSNYYYKAHLIDSYNVTILAELAFAKYISGSDKEAIFYINKANTINPYNDRVNELYQKLNSI